MRKKQKSHVPRALRRLFPHLKSVVDAAAPVSVTVTKGDCDRAEALNPAECALAQAAKRQFHAEGAVIGLGSSYVIKGNKAVRFATPERIRREIVSFDRHRDFRPGSYNLVPKAPTSRLGATHLDPNRPHGSHNQPRRVFRRSDGVRVLTTKVD